MQDYLMLITHEEIQTKCAIFYSVSILFFIFSLFFFIISLSPIHISIGDSDTATRCSKVKREHVKVFSMNAPMKFF